MCYTGLLVHGVLPESMLSVTLVPVVKDKVGKLNSSDNYLPIAIESVMSKVMETVILYRIERHILFADNQFGSKRKRGTDLCIFALKEILDLYNRHNSTMFMCLTSQGSFTIGSIHHADEEEHKLDDISVGD